MPHVAYFCVISLPSKGIICVFDLLHNLFFFSFFKKRLYREEYGGAADSQRDGMEPPSEKHFHAL